MQSFDLRNFMFRDFSEKSSKLSALHIIKGTFSNLGIVQSQSFLFNLFNPLSPARDRFFVEICNPITRHAIELESCSNPLRIQQVLSSKLKKKTFFAFGGGFLEVTSQ